MDRGKVKTAIIAILFILDLVLGALLVWQTATAHKVRRDAFLNLQSVMHSNGVELLLERLPSSEGVYSLRSERSVETEASLALLLTSSDQGQDQGGNIYYYTGATGEAWFRGSGDFEVVFADSAADPEALLRRALASYGLDPAAGKNVQQVNGRSIFNCTAEVTYVNSYPTGLTGRLVAGACVDDLSAPAMDASTALMRFIATLDDYGFICTEVTSLELGYTMSALVTGTFQLTPVWSVVTDTGEYYVNAISGAVERHSVA